MLSQSARLTALAERRVGTSLRRGKYQLDALLGVGSMAAVYRASHRNGKLVAVKMLHTELVADDALHARFLRESYIANQVDHPGLVRVLDDDVDDDGATFLVLELLEGRTLEDERQALGGTLPPQRALEIVRELLLVLVAVHARGVVHRDLKPDNVFLTTSGAVKLLDLGIAHLGESRLTVAGQALGSPAYMAPEQARGEHDQVDARSDLFGVGAILFTLLTGRAVHEGPNPRARLIMAATQQARSVFEVWPEAKGAVANVVDVALRFEKTQRWSSAEQMLQAIDGVLGLIRPATVRPPSMTPPGAPPAPPPVAAPIAAPPALPAPCAVADPAVEPAAGPATEPEPGPPPLPRAPDTVRGWPAEWSADLPDADRPPR